MKKSVTPKLHAQACNVRNEHAGKTILLRGVVEFTNSCHHNCLYCGMRSSNRSIVRYNLDSDAIVKSAAAAQVEGIGTIMLQGGDNLKSDIGALVDAVRHIRFELGLTVLLCIGDHPLRDYQTLFAAGAQQAIVKFETSNEGIYQQLRPHSTLGARLDLIYKLTDIGYKVSSGFIFGLPGTNDTDVERDLELCRNLPLFAASVSPFIPSEQTPLADANMPSLDKTLDCLARLRLACPSHYIPAVSALNLLAKHEQSVVEGQLLGLQAGANLLTVNFTPPTQREMYSIYSSSRSIVELDFARKIAREALC